MGPPHCFHRRNCKQTRLRGWLSRFIQANKPEENSATSSPLVQGFIGVSVAINDRGCILSCGRHASGKNAASRRRQPWVTIKPDTHLACEKKSATGAATEINFPSRRFAAKNAPATSGRAKLY